MDYFGHIFLEVKPFIRNAPDSVTQLKGLRIRSQVLGLNE